MTPPLAVTEIAVVWPPVPAPGPLLALGVTAAEAEDLVYARVDLVREADGALALMELELTEPSLFLTLHEPAAQALAAAVASRLS